MSYCFKLNSPLSQFFSEGPSNPKHSKRRVDEVIGDDAVTDQGMTTVTTDPSVDSARVTPGQALPVAILRLEPAVPIAALGQAPSLAGELTPSSALGAAPTPKALRVKKIAFKKSSL